MKSNQSATEAAKNRPGWKPKTQSCMWRITWSLLLSGVLNCFVKMMNWIPKVAFALLLPGTAGRTIFRPSCILIGDHRHENSFKTQMAKVLPSIRRWSFYKTEASNWWPHPSLHSDHSKLEFLEEVTLRITSANTGQPSVPSWCSISACSSPKRTRFYLVWCLLDPLVRWAILIGHWTFRFCHLYNESDGYCSHLIFERQLPRVLQESLWTRMA